MCTYEWARALVYVKVDAFSGVSESVTKKKKMFGRAGVSCGGGWSRYKPSSLGGRFFLYGYKINCVWDEHL